MSQGRDIRAKMQSIKSTQKITSAMEMVAASKMRKAQDAMAATRPYAKQIQRMAQHVANCYTDYSHPFMEKRERQSIGIILISTDRGLCGGLNINLFRQLIQKVEAWQAEGLTVKMAAIGAKGFDFLKGLDVELVAAQEDLGETPEVFDIIGAVQVMSQKFKASQIDELYVAYNLFENSMTQKPSVEPLLPLSILPEDAVCDMSGKARIQPVYLYEPEPKVLMDALLGRFIETEVYQALLENCACEQSARMVAMKSATDNAGDLLDDLQLVYNKARQAAITQELSEIVSGASAV